MRMLPHYEFPRVTDIPDNLVRGAHLLIDIDNTVAEDQTVVVPADIAEWLTRVCDKGRCAFVSNSASFQRSRWKELQTQFPDIVAVVSEHAKPSPQLLEDVRTKIPAFDSQKMVVIGDRLFTDAWFAHRIGATSIRVQPLGDYTQLHTWCAIQCERVFYILARLFHV